MTENHEFYRVEKAADSPTECACDACAVWTILYREHGDTVDTELGQSWRGAEGKETAEDVCSLMNMAFEQGLELPPRADLDQLLGSLRQLCTCEEASPLCLYCDALEQIEAQARTLNLLQGRMAGLQKELNAARDGEKSACLAIVSGEKS